MNIKDLNATCLVCYFLKEESISPRKMQKLCYFANCWSLAIYDQPIVKDLEFEAWLDGPINPEIYNVCAQMATWYERMDIIEDEEIIEDIDRCFSGKQKDLLNLIFGTYGQIDDDTIDALARSDAPYIKALEHTNVTEGHFEKINHHLIAEHYKKNRLLDISALITK